MFYIDSISTYLKPGAEETEHYAQDPLYKGAALSIRS